MATKMSMPDAALPSDRSENNHHFLDSRLSAYLEMAGDWAFELNSNEIIVFCHQSISAADPLSSAELVGKHFSMFVAERSRPKVSDLLRTCRGERSRRRTTYIDDTGCHIELEIMSRFAQGAFDGYYVLVRNLSQRLSTGWREADSAKRMAAGPEAPGPQAEGDAQLQLRRQELVANLWMTFAGLDRVEAIFQQALKMVGQFLDVDRVYLSADNTAAATFSCLYEWCSPHAEPMIDHTQNVPYDNRHEAYLRLLTLPYVAVNNTASLPAVEQQKPDSPATKAYVNLPIFVDGAFWGLLGIDACRGSRNWSLGEMNLLQTVGGIIQSALEKQRMEGAVMEAYSKLDGIVKNYPGIIWYLDNSYTLTASHWRQR